MIIAVCNQKGGVGKTATAQAIATGAAMIGRKSLAVDLDAQSNLTFSMGGNSADAGAYELMTGRAKPGQIIQTTAQGDIIPASMNLATADSTLTGQNRSTALADALKPVKKKYDVITIDCPPALNILLVNALTAADVVIIPITADMYALQGLYQLKQSIQAAQKINKALKIGGAVFTRHSTRTILARDLADVIKDKCAELEIPVYDTVIREGVAIREAQTQRQSIYDYAPRSNPAKDYKQLIKEIGI
jgi:chromosome partitioning protein